MYKIKTEGIYKDVSSNKEMFDFSNCSTKSKYCDDSNNLVNVNKKIVATINHNEHKDGLLNNKGIRHSINRTQIKDHKDENI